MGDGAVGVSGAVGFADVQALSETTKHTPAANQRVTADPPPGIMSCLTQTTRERFEAAYVRNRIAPGASLTTSDGEPIDWPDTHQLLVARR